MQKDRLEINAPKKTGRKKRGVSLHRNCHQPVTQLWHRDVDYINRKPINKCRLTMLECVFVAEQVDRLAMDGTDRSDPRPKSVAG